MRRCYLGDEKGVKKNEAVATVVVHVFAMELASMVTPFTTVVLFLFESINSKILVDLFVAVAFKNNNCCRTKRMMKMMLPTYLLVHDACNDRYHP